MISFILAAVAWIFGTMFSGALAGALHLPLPSLPQSVSQAEGFLYFALASLILAGGTALVAGHLRGQFKIRWMALAALLFICVGVNTAIEAVLFSSTILPAQGFTLAGMDLIPSLLAAAILALRRRRPGDGKEDGDETQAGVPHDASFMTFAPTGSQATRVFLIETL